jgi:AcrR family transcriptional regulator
MTDKKEKIIQAALELFAQKGFKATSTKKVAIKAGVSEGLIFRHFKNKEDLLQAILFMGEKRIKLLFADILFETDPKTVIRKTIETVSPGYLSKEELEFWKLQYKIKWELEQYGEHKMEPLQLALNNAFEKLGYDEPEMEANHLLTMIDGMATRYFLMEEYDLAGMITFLKKHYSV